MNRAMRRQLINNPQLFNKTIITYTEEQQRKAIEFAIKSMAAVVAISLHDKFGWGKDRINKLLAYAGNQYACCNKGTVNIDDIMQWCREYGVEIDWDGEAK